MPIARFQLPDGRIARFEVPDGMTPEQAQASMEQHFAQQEKPAQSFAFDPMRDMTATERFFAGAGKAVADLGRGAKQMVGMVSRDDVAEARRLDAPLMSTTAGKVGNFAGYAGALIPTALIPGANTLAGAGMIGATAGALQPSVSTGETLANIGLGGAGGMAGQKVASWIGDAVRKAGPALSAGQEKAAQLAAQLGIRLTPGQQTGSKALQKVEAALESNPMTSRPFDRLGQANQKTYNTIAAKGVGESADNLANDVLGRANARLGAVFDKVADATKVPLDPMRVAPRLRQVIDDTEGLIGANGSLADNALFKRLDGFVNETGGATREQLRNLSSKLGKAARNNMTSQAGDRELGKALFALKDIVDDEVVGTLSGAAKQEFAEALKQYRTMMQLTTRTNVVNPSSGDVNMRALASYLQQKDKGGFARGGNQSDLYNAARVAQAFPPVVGNSGTSTRSMGATDWLASLPMSLVSRAYLSAPSAAMFRGVNSGTQGLLGAAAEPALMMPLGANAGLLGAAALGPYVGQ